MLYAHSLSDKPEELWQPLDAHHSGVAELAEAFAAFGAPKTAALLGKIHDTGKRSKSFQNRLRTRGGKVDHTSAAYLYLLREWARGPHAGDGVRLAQLLAYPLLGHHGGMADFGSQAESGTLVSRLSGARLRAVPDWNAASAAPLPPMETILAELAPLMCPEGRRPDAFATAFLLRMLFSCLVDADYLDTERFCARERHELRPAWPALATLEEGFFRYLEGRGFLREAAVEEAALHAGAETACGTAARRGAIRLARQFLLRRCMAAAEERPGLFSLTMPTGGGKTLSSMAFALRHARRHDLRRVILVVPYTSIIEQNADALREALGKDAVLEHHSNYLSSEGAGAEDGGDADLAYKLSTENWDATVIVTTSVQFFESLFDNRPSRCRKLHNMARSVIILDEVQMLPVPLVAPCLAALKLLAGRYGSSVVLCTATQPALMRAPFLEEGLPPKDVREIVPAAVSPALFRIFERARVECRKEAMDDAELAEALRAERQALCIVNSRRYARELFALLDGGDADFHLSARMTPEHRTRVLATVRRRLAEGLPCRVVSTSLIECGVDISFPVVMREKNGLDVLAQAAGRCNREGGDREGSVVCFASSRAAPARAAELNRRRAAFDRVARAEGLFSPETIRAYFEHLYSASDLDEEGILKLTSVDGGSSVGIWQFQFARIARRFRFIGDETVSVIIEQGEAAELLRQAEPYGAFAPSTLRRLQRHSVQVYRHELERMRADGRIETRNGFLQVLSGGVGYSEKTGLDVTLEDGVPVADLLY
ncbi:CRISPR-associated helicase Cas3' [uncultured Desulfovibrio sp.]|uniref:CRISPR-associated helicase Cas3' n=1 Tax=uncultured Desulfovibrio sp. TaxID=167968 RepID=UPI002806221B|nr:CRISPR-associated helicase Cas3' [uncultured Desulfovibrio sp.]